MPRMSASGNTTMGQTYLIGLSDRKGHTTSDVRPAPSSAKSLPRIASLPKTPSLPAPSSLRNSVSMFNSRSQGMVSPTLSPRRTRTVSELPTVMSTDSAPRIPNRRLRAAENGRGTVLPDFNQASFGSSHPSQRTTRSREAPDRVRTRSSPSLKQVMNLTGYSSSGSSPSLPQTSKDVGPKQSMLQKAKNSLRRRTPSCPSDDEDGFRRGGRGDYDSPYRSSRRGRRGALYHWQKFSRMKLGHMLQVIIVLAVTALVWESHQKALFAAEQLSQFKEEESMLILHLQKIEQQSIQLHENLSRLAQSGVRSEPRNGAGGDTVDFDLIHKQTQQLYQMEEELNHEVRTLQTRIQQSARNHIIQEFGEGPVQVILELNFGAEEGPSRISILLWHDTPHAAWAWLEQIGRHIWDGAVFSWQQGHIIEAAPKRNDPVGGKIEFVEQSQHGHEAWTVGLRESDSGVLGMYINLQDNTNLHKHETCVGKVIDGFDALQRLLELSRNRKDEGNASIVIKQASAMHVTKKEGGP